MLLHEPLISLGKWKKHFREEDILFPYMYDNT